MQKYNVDVEPWETEDLDQQLINLENVINTERTKLKTEAKIEQNKKEKCQSLPISLAQKNNQIKILSRAKGEFTPSHQQIVTETIKSKSQPKFQIPLQQKGKMRSMRLISSSCYPRSQGKIEGKSLPFKEIIPYFKSKHRNLRSEQSQTLREKFKRNNKSANSIPEHKKIHSIKAASQKKRPRLITYNINDHFLPKEKDEKEFEINSSFSNWKQIASDKKSQRKSSKVKSIFRKKNPQEEQFFEDLKIYNNRQEILQQTKKILQKKPQNHGRVFQIQQKWQLGIHKKASITNKQIENSKKNKLGQIFYI